MIKPALRFACARSGAASVEGALIFPAMLALLGLSVVFAQAFEIKRKVAQTARTVTDLVARYGGVNADNTSGPLELASLNADLAAAFATMQPFSNGAPNATAMVVTMLQADSAGATGKVQWSQAYNGVARKAGATLTLPAGVASPNGYVILGEASFAYAPIEIGPVPSTYLLQSSIYMPPRLLTCVTVQTIYPACGGSGSGSGGGGGGGSGGGDGEDGGDSGKGSGDGGNNGSSGSGSGGDDGGSARGSGETGGGGTSGDGGGSSSKNSGSGGDD